MRETLDQWSFVIAAYGVTVAATLVLAAWSWLGMRAAERRKDLGAQEMSTAFKPKHQRLVLVVIALLAMVAAALLAAWALRNQASYFYVPSDVAAGPPSAGQEIRLGGMVEAGSLKTRADGITIDFVVGDGKARVPVTFSGIVPNLFVEGSGVVAEGAMRPDGTFAATNLLAKHDENYVPRELEDMTKEQKRAAVAETQ